MASGVEAASPHTVPARRAKGTGSLTTSSMFSTSLGHDVQLVVYLPPDYSPSTTLYPVLYLLHGLPGSGPSMVRALDLQSQVDGLIDSKAIQPMIIVAPSDGPTRDTDTEWINSRTNPSARWGTFVSSDLVRWVEDNFSVCSTRSGTAIGGLSMGAFGAISNALRHLSEYGAVTLWSPYFVSNTPLVDGPVGSSSWLADSPLLNLPTLVTALRAEPLRISIYVGTSDEFYAQTVQFVHELSRYKLKRRFSAYDAGHSYRLWRSELATQLKWLSAGEHC